MTQYSLTIGGTPAVTTKTFNVVNPADETIVAACPAHADLFNHMNAPKGSLLRRLDRDAAPAWLAPLSGPGEPLRLYSVR